LFKEAQDSPSFLVKNWLIKSGILTTTYTNIDICSLFSDNFIMLPILNFYSNHNLNFKNNNINTLEYYAISELRKIDIPNEILLMVYDDLRIQLPGIDISKIIKINNWQPISIPDISKKYISTIGPMGLRVIFSSSYIYLPQILYERADWYSPLNREK
jgi:hypothetical protein